ncbi:MAG TPA: hypothetical protein VM638_04020 [Actinomycetota bacterium]|nr:hypothetical protein [Actinomycetota bacterium]
MEKMTRGSVWLAAALILAACPAGEEPSPTPSVGPTAVSRPYPYTTPTPPAEPTEIDGWYARQVGKDVAGGPGPCRRCPPYRLEVGTATLSFDRGVFRVTNDPAEEGALAWKSVGHYEVEGHEVVIFNDPNCPTARGRYRWALAGGELTLEVVQDDCAFGGLRWRYLTAAAWTAA